MPHGSARGRSRLGLVDEIGSRGFAQQRRRQLARLAQVVGQRQRLIDQVARMGAAQWNTARGKHPVDEIVDEPFVVMEAALLATALENQLEIIERGTFGEHFVTDAAEESLVEQLRRL